VAFSSRSFSNAKVTVGVRPKNQKKPAVIRGSRLYYITCYACPKKPFPQTWGHEKRKKNFKTTGLNLNYLIIKCRYGINCSNMLGMLVICEYAIAYFAKTHISHIFPHIMAFSESHMRKLCCICKNSHISKYAIAFFSTFLVQHCFKTAKYFGSKRLPVFAIRS